MPEFPIIQTAGVDGMLVSFANALNEPANRAALAFRAALEQAGWDGMEETASTLVSVYVRFDPFHVTHAQMRTRLQSLCAQSDWFGADLPEGRRSWRIPTVFGAPDGPQLAQAAEAAGMSEAEAITSLSSARLRVQTIGFAPGQPYIGELPAHWDIPRRQTLSSPVAEGALVVAIRQLVLFSVSTPTGWSQVGQTAVRLFQPEANEPFMLRPGDEVQFTQTEPEQLSAMRKDRHGGAVFEVVR